MRAGLLDNRVSLMNIIDLGLDQIGIMLGFGEKAYRRFTTKEGVGGLAKWKDGRLDILAIHTDDEGKGHLRDFIARSKQEFDTICIWEIWNANLAAALKRYGFEDETEIQGDGETLTGMRWDKKGQP